MSKGLKVIGLIIFGSIILIVGFVSIRYVIHSDGDKYSADADYESIHNVEDAYEESQKINHETIEEESFAEAFESFITEEPAIELETQDDEIVGEESVQTVSNEGVSEELVEEPVPNEGVSEELVEEPVPNEGVSEESVEEKELNEESNEEPNEEESVTDEASIDDEITEYTGDEYIDITIHEHRDEIADEDIVSGLSIADRIDSNVVYGYLEDGLTDEERGELSYYLHSILSDAEYAKLKELFYKYNYILE